MGAEYMYMKMTLFPFPFPHIMTPNGSIDKVHAYTH